MVSKSDRSWPPWAATIVLLALGIVLGEAGPCFADGCGGYYKARQVLAICHDVVKAKGVKSHQRIVEFEKCKNNSETQKQIQELAVECVDRLD